MTRTAKTTAQLSLSPQADGYTAVRFESPKLVRAARAERGHARMTPSEYAAHRLGRGAMGADMVAGRRVALAETKRRQRIVGGRRVTGFQAGTRRRTNWR